MASRNGGKISIVLRLILSVPNLSTGGLAPVKFHLLFTIRYAAMRGTTPSSNAAIWKNSHSWRGSLSTGAPKSRIKSKPMRPLVGWTVGFQRALDAGQRRHRRPLLNAEVVVAEH